MKKKEEQFDYVGLLAGVSDPENQQHIAKNLQSVHHLLQSDTYQKTVQLHVRQVMNEMIARVCTKLLPEKERDYAVGFIAALRVIYDLPNTVAKQIAGEKTERPAPKGDAGY